MSDLRKFLVAAEWLHRFSRTQIGEAGPNCDKGHCVQTIAPGPPFGICSTDDRAATPFDFHIYPHVSVGSIGTVIIASLLALPAALMSIFFTIKGYWPVCIFVVLTFLGFVAALTCSQLSLRRRERIFLSDGIIVVERSKASGTITQTRIPVCGLRLESVVDPDFGHLCLTLRSRARRVEIARDLSPIERSKFQTAFIDVMNRSGYSIALTVTASPAAVSAEQPK